MLNTHESSKSKLWKYSLIVPFLVAFIFLFQIETVAQVREKPTKQQQIQERVELRIDKNSTDEEIKKETTRIQDKYGVTVKVSKIKRNSSDEIVSLKMDYKDKQGNSGSTHINGNKPIDPFSFFLNSNNGKMNMGFNSYSKKGTKTVVSGSQKNEEEGLAYSFSNEEVLAPPTPPSPPTKSFERVEKVPTPPKFPEAPMVPSNLQDEKEMKKFEEKMAVFEMKMKKMEPQIAQFEKEMEEYEKEMQGFEPDMKVFEKQMEEFEKKMEAYQEQIIQNKNIVIDKRTERREEINQEQDREIKIARLRAEESQKAREEAHKAAIKSKIAAEEAKVKAERAKRKAEIEKRIAEEEKKSEEEQK